MDNWPLPPFYKDAKSAQEQAPVEAVIFAPEGKILGGRLERFLPESLTVSFAAHGDATVRSIPFTHINSIQLIHPMALVADTELLDLHREAVGQIASPSMRAFRVRFVDGEQLQGQTKGFVRTRRGLFIFLSTEAERVVRIFIPENALASYQVGGLAGLPLVKPDPLRPAQDGRRLDAHPEDGGIRNAESLAQKISQLHGFAPVRLGDILMNRGLVSRDQMFEALRRMKLGRHPVLSTVLVEMEALTRAKLTQAGRTS